jgi:hypothetical protein
MMPLGAPRFWTRVRSIVERDYGELVDQQVRVTINDPIAGTAESRRVRKVNLDIDADDRDGEGTDNVVPITPIRAAPCPEPMDTLLSSSTAGFTDLDDGDLDLSDIPF